MSETSTFAADLRKEICRQGLDGSEDDVTERWDSSAGAKATAGYKQVRSTSEDGFEKKKKKKKKHMIVL